MQEQEKQQNQTGHVYVRITIDTGAEQGFFFFFFFFFLQNLIHHLKLTELAFALTIGMFRTLNIIPGQINGKKVFPESERYGECLFGYSGIVHTDICTFTLVFSHGNKSCVEQGAP